jgi:hypothetical protein
MMNSLTRALFTSCLFAATLFACGGDPVSAPEQELRAWIDDGVEAAEAKERRRLVGMVSPAYADARGNERSDIEELLRVYMFRQNRIVLLPDIEEITVYDDTAAMIVMTVAMAGTNDGVLGFSADAYRFALELEKGGSGWRLISARWGELGDELR